MPGVASNGIRLPTDYKVSQFASTTTTTTHNNSDDVAKNKIEEEGRTRTRLALFGVIRKELGIVTSW
jgi:hypothetical protein